MCRESLRKHVLGKLQVAHRMGGRRVELRPLRGQRPDLKGIVCHTKGLLLYSSRSRCH